MEKTPKQLLIDDYMKFSRDDWDKIVLIKLFPDKTTTVFVNNNVENEIRYIKNFCDDDLYYKNEKNRRILEYILIPKYI